jgi:hypothetical protein
MYLPGSNSYTNSLTSNNLYSGVNNNLLGSFPILDFTGFGASSASGSNLNYTQSSQFNLLDNKVGNNSQSNLYQLNHQTSINNPIPSLNLPQSSEPIKQIYKNNEIVVYASISKSFDKSQISCCFYVSNNIDNLITNVKLNLSVKKHVNCKVLCTSGTTLEQMKSMGIKKV